MVQGRKKCAKVEKGTRKSCGGVKKYFLENKFNKGKDKNVEH